MNDQKERIQKYLANRGVASRRSIEALINQKKIKVNGTTATLGQRVDISDQIVIDGKIFKSKQTAPVVYMVYKPAGLISTTSDEQGRATVVDLVKTTTRLYPVGRLDKNSTGLLLLTNDGQLANRLSHPRYEVSKEYVVKLNRPLSEEKLTKIKQAVTIDDTTYHIDSIIPLGQNSYRIVLHEGRNREIRKIIAAMHREVISLQRVKIGRLSLGDLKVGKARLLSPDEIKDLLAE
jgi:23S rRNA pseudouridine2605 synthase